MNIQQIAQDAGVSVDEVRARWMVLRVAQWKANFQLFCKDIIKIRSKSGDLEPLIFNEAQRLLLGAAEDQLKTDRWVRLLGLKSRRMGFSTMVAARGYWRTILWERQNAYILAHEMAASSVLFDMVALMQEKNPFPPVVGTDNAKQLTFTKRGSSYQVATAGQKAGGRGSSISFMHASEAAWWVSASEHFAASVQAVDEVRGQWGVLWTEHRDALPFEKGIGTVEGWVKAPTEVWIETTSAGPMGEFYKRYLDAMKGIGRYRAIFVPWNIQKEYEEQGDFNPSQDAEDEGELSEAEYQQAYKLTDEQMLWRRSKIQELGSIGKFRQEYPIDVPEAFAAADVEDIFIKPMMVLKARKRVMADPDAPLILGVDPAGSGGDRFAVAFRRGDKCLKVTYRNKLEHDDAVAWLSHLIEQHQPNRVNIDRGSMGANIMSSLRNISPKYQDLVRGVDFGGRSKAKVVNPSRAGPFNKRAEIWGRMREWLIEGGSIPDDDELVADLSAPKQKFRANNDWILESKTDLKTRGIRSTDLGDALALTFAFDEFFEQWTKPKQFKGWGTGAPQPIAFSEGHMVGNDKDIYDQDPGTGGGWMI